MLIDALASRGQQLLFSLRATWELLRPPDSGETSAPSGATRDARVCVSIDLFEHVDVAIRQLHAKLAPQPPPTQRQADGESAAGSNSGRLDEPMGELEADDTIACDGLESSMRAQACMNGADEHELSNSVPHARTADLDERVPAVSIRIPATTATTPMDPHVASLATPMDMSHDETTSTSPLTR